MIADCRGPVVALALCLAAGVSVGQSVGYLYFTTGTIHFATDQLRFGSAELLAPVQATATEQRFRLSGDVLFEFDKAAIQPAAEPVLAGLAERIRAAFAGAPIRVEGHTDAKGSDAYNRDLSVRRANSVKAWFEAHGFGVPIHAAGLGESQPVEPNELPDGSDNPRGRQQNRRVEIIVENHGS